MLKDNEIKGISATKSQFLVQSTWQRHFSKTHQAGCWSPGCGGETAGGRGWTTTGSRWRAERAGSVWTVSSPQCCRPAIGPRKRHYGRKEGSKEEESWEGWDGSSVNKRQRAPFALARAGRRGHLWQSRIQYSPHEFDPHFTPKTARLVWWQACTRLSEQKYQVQSWTCCTGITNHSRRKKIKEKLQFHYNEIKYEGFFFPSGKIWSGTHVTCFVSQQLLSDLAQQVVDWLIDWSMAFFVCCHLRNKRPNLHSFHRVRRVEL